MAIPGVGLVLLSLLVSQSPGPAADRPRGAPRRAAACEAAPVGRIPPCLRTRSTGEPRACRLGKGLAPACTEARFEDGVLVERHALAGSRYFRAMYPSVHGLRDEQVERRLNDWFRTAVAPDRLLAALPNTLGLPACVIDPALVVDGTRQCELDEDFLVASRQGRVLTLERHGYVYPLDAIRPSNHREFVHLDLASGRALDLDDLLIQGPEARARLDEILREMTKADAKRLFPGNPFESLSKHESGFTVTADALRIWFEPGEIGPLSLGSPSYEIPFEALDGVVEWAGPFWRALGDGSKPRDELAQYERRCAKEPLACWRAGDMLRSGRVRRDAAKALGLYRKACDAKELRGCALLGEMHLAGEGTARDVPKAVGLFSAACAGGHQEACSLLGALHLQGEGVPRDEPKARKLFEEACAQADGRGCGMLGGLVAQGAAGFAPDPAAAIEQFRKACNNGYGPGCRELAKAHWSGATKDAGQAAAGASLGCHFEDGWSCVLLGSLFENGALKADDLTQALALFEMGCTRGCAEGCARLGGIFAEGRAGVARSPAKAFHYWRLACDLEDGAGCHRVGLAHSKGEGAVADPAVAKEYFERGCRLGNSEACTALPPP